MPRKHDLFLSYNSRDHAAVRQVYEALKSGGFNPWLDREALTPGRLWQAEAEKGLKSCRAAAVFIGPNGIGPWENLEMRALLTRVAQEGFPLIPVPLPGAPEKLDLPAFLAELTWVDLRGGITEARIAELIRGIPSKKSRSKPPSKPVSLGPPRLHNLPPALGDWLTGRDDEMQALAASLEGGSPTAIVQRHKALYGLGGIGKTRLAVEYAWRFGSRYTAAFFVRADSPEGLRTGLAALARADLLALSESKAEEETVHAVVRWLKLNPGWLLILDNVDTKEAEIAVLALLQSLAGGHVLITSRVRDWPRNRIHTQPLGTIPLAEARDFLLKRTDGDRRTTPDDIDRAQELAEKLDGLPLALEQAGAYIVHTRLSFSKYLEVWEEERQRVLEWHDEAVMGYPASVAATWKASFDRLKPTAATLLRLSAFLAPDPIPEKMFESKKEIVEEACELLRSETGHADGAGSIHEALGELESYSLIARQEGTFAVHRVVQEVLQSRVPPERLKDWIEAALKIVNGYSPVPPDDVRTWPVWNGLRPHAARVVLLADGVGLANPTSRLMGQLAIYLETRGLYAETEPLMRRALDMDEASFGSQHPKVATDLNNLAQLLQATDRLSEAEPLMRRALDIDVASSGSEHPKVAIRLNNLAHLLQATNRLSEAEPLMRRALDIDEASFGSQHPDVAIDLNNLAMLLQDTNRLSEAEPLMRRALDIDVASSGSEHPKVARDLNNLAMLLHDTNRLSEAEPLMRRALDIDEASFGSQHPDVARDLNNLARLLQATNRLSEAEPLMRRAVEIFERSLGPDHPNTRIVQGNLAALLEKITSESSPPPAPGRGGSV
ncbi:MAG: hypothetical protein QOH06_4347 [Acidobacteriota bacterium]|jgi:tetratricopeptide (TPR) repeat protein|nr:hypothetical protein [Acidobacteriota bacterium]